MLSELSKHEYLKRYLENEKDSDRKRKKKLKKKVPVLSLKIIDEDISLKSINFGDKVEEDEGDEKPVVAEIIDERPLEEKIKELYESSRWKKFDDESSRIDSVTELRENGSKPDSESLKGKTTIGKCGQSNSKKLRHDSDSDLSPPRSQDRIVRKQHYSSDLSPRTQNRSLESCHFLPALSPQRNSKRNLSDSDISPPRTHKQRKSIKNKAKKLGKTLSGLKAGLQNSKTLQKEILELREREKHQLNTLDDEVSGKNASTIIRDRKTGLKLDLNQEQQVKDEEDKKTKEYQQKYAQWGKGIEQAMEKKDKFMDDLYEMSKPLARYEDDKDLDERLKSIIHDEDPMSEYIKKKRQKDTPKYPVYTGPAAPPNRFVILPGYRWDGVDRSNGFEKKYFEKVNKSKAVETEAYLWSVQDM